MAITIDDFDKVWASQSPLTPYEFNDAQYKEGWNFVGGAPPSRQMWDFLQKNNDEKSQYLLNKFENYLPLSGGTLTGDVLGVTPPNGDNSKKLANTEFIQALASILVPIGCVQAFAGNTLPDGWLLCDGSAVSRTDYADLYSVIGDTYGAGDGSTTFNLPNLCGRVPIGVGTGTDSRETNTYNVGATGGEYSHKLSVTEMPSHEHQVTWLQNNPLSLNQGSIDGYNISWQSGVNDMDGFVANAVGGNGLHNNVQPYLALNYIIKY